MTLFNEYGHLSKTTIQKLKGDVLSYDEKMPTLSHIAVCDNCCERYIQSFNKNTYIEPIAPLSPEIKSVIKQKRKQKIFFLFNLKVGFAVLASLMLVLYFPVQNTRDHYTEIEQNWSRSISQTVAQLQERINTISDKMNTGGNFFEKTEK